MRPLITLGLALALVACGASAPSPAPDDASTSDGGGENGCPWMHVRLAGACVPATDDACGPRRIRCPQGTWCVIESGRPGELAPEDFHCDRRP